MHDGTCCAGCGMTPPYTVLNRTAHERHQAKKRILCATVDCPLVNCESPPPCRAIPKPKCVQGRCAVQMVMTKDECGSPACDPARCGAQPPPVADGQCAYEYERRWERCCCETMGGVGCGAVSCSCAAPAEAAKHPELQTVCGAKRTPLKPKGPTCDAGDPLCTP